MKARLPKNEMCCDWLWLWLANSLDSVSVLSRPLTKQQVHQYCHINSDLENIEDDRAEPLHARILQDQRDLMIIRMYFT